MSLAVKKSSSKDGSKAPIQSEPVKCNIFTWTRICCYAHKYRHKLRSTTSNNIPVVSKDEQQGSSISSDLLRGNVKHLLTLENLELENFEIESIFRFDRDHLSGPNMSIGLQSMKLGNLHKMMYICVGPKNSFTLQNLEVLTIVECGKLEVIFPGSIVRCLPQLEIIWVEKCEELKQIIEEDEENQKLSNLLSSKQCFPKLRALIVNKCNKLKRLFPVSASKELPNLELLIINEASELEEVFGCEQRAQEVELPKLKQIIFIHLPNLCQGIELQSVRHRLVLNCPQLQTSPSTLDFSNELLSTLAEELRTLRDFDIDFGLVRRLGGEIYQSIERVKTQDTSNRSPTAESTSDISHGSEVQAASERESPSSQEDVVAPEHPATKDDVGDSQEASEFVVDPPETRAPVSLNDDASTKVSSIIEEQFSKDDVIGLSESKPSPIASQSPSLPMDVFPFEGNPSQIEEDSSVVSFVTRELEQLVASKNLAPENLSLLTDFLKKHPSVRLADNVHGKKYKGYAYNCLADLLKFLQTYSALDVLGSCRSDFTDLLQDVRSFGFDKDWLDDVERRAFFPGSEVSQDALQKLLDSKHQATQEVEGLRLEIGNLTQQLASSEAVLENIIQQEAQVLKARAALSAPLGY